ncbi:MAG: hypothetical protein E7071_02745 [Bacteroidales bacterium]|nr:hypothetical protein [Bacteroidales bacterium]
MAVNKINYDRIVDKKMSMMSTAIVLALFVVTIVMICLFSFGPYDAELEGPEYTEALLNWAYALLGISIIAALVFPIIAFITKPKQGFKNLLPLLGLVAVAAVCYYVSDNTVLELPGYNGSDNNPETIQWSEAILFLTYVMMILNIAAIIITELFKKIKK